MRIRVTINAVHRELHQTKSAVNANFTHSASCENTQAALKQSFSSMILLINTPGKDFFKEEKKWVSPAWHVGKKYSRSGSEIHLLMYKMFKAKHMKQTSLKNSKNITVCGSEMPWGHPCFILLFSRKLEKVDFFLGDVDNDHYTWV